MRFTLTLVEFMSEGIYSSVRWCSTELLLIILSYISLAFWVESPWCCAHILVSKWEVIGTQVCTISIAMKTNITIEFICLHLSIGMLVRLVNPVVSGFLEGCFSLDIVGYVYMHFCDLCFVLWQKDFYIALVSWYLLFICNWGRFKLGFFFGWRCHYVSLSLWWH